MLAERVFTSAFLQVKACTATCLLPERTLDALEAGRRKGKNTNS